MPGSTSNPTARQQAAAARSTAGFRELSKHAFIRVSGADAAGWLQSQTTNDLLGLQHGEGQLSALLDRKGRLQASFSLHRWEDEYWLLTEQAQRQRLINRLDQYVFLEEVEIHDDSAAFGCLSLQGPQSALVLAALAGASQVPPHVAYSVKPLETAGGVQMLVFNIPQGGESGFVVVVQKEQVGALREALAAAGAVRGLVELDEQAAKMLRVEAGEPVWDGELDAERRITDTPLEATAVSYEKGCYPGQEVVAKIKNFSSPRYALMGLELEREDAPEGAVLSLRGKEVGRLCSTAYSPMRERPAALAYLERSCRTPGASFTFQTDQGPVQGVPQMLPLYEPPTVHERAAALYEQALERFEADAEDMDATAIELLRDAVTLDPEFEDAYEVMGVVLNRQGRVDEAIDAMQVLARLNPQSVMAHTNLSVFYVAKGMIQEAEEEKAKAAMLERRHEAAESQAKELARQERERIEAEARERIAMFEEVLEIDPDDALAIFGLGSAWLQLGEFARALPYFERAAQEQTDYSAAWLNLGKCLEQTGKSDEARDAYTRGIAAAGRKGDLMPLKEMERRLKQLDAPKV